MRRVLALILALALASPACAQIYPGYGTPTLLGDGTAAAPSYSFAGNSGVGLFRGSEGTSLAFSAASAARIAFRASASSGQAQLLENVAATSAGAGGLCWTSGTNLGINGTCDRLLVTTAAAGTLTATGPSGAAVNLGGVVFVDTTTTGNAAGTGALIKTYTVPANVLNVNGKTIHIVAEAFSANNANAKAIGIQLCGLSQIAYNATASISGGFKVEAYITRTGTNAQAVFVNVTEGLTTGTLTQAKFAATGAPATATCNETGTIALGLWANGTGANDIQSQFMLVELLN